MVFDNIKMVSLREKYEGKKNFEVPKIVLLDRYDGYLGERNIIEKLVSDISTEQLPRWMGNFLDEQDNRHIGAWFEIMLFGWLQQHFHVRFEPIIEGSNPDYAIEIGSKLIIIEATAHGLSLEQRAKKKVSANIYSVLESIKKPYFVQMRVSQYGLTINKKSFTQFINQWLDSPEPPPLHFQDDLGNIFEFVAEYKPNQKNIIVGCIEGYWVNHEELKQPLRKKAKQHRSIRKAGYPYIIAMFLESSILSGDEVVSAWLGLPSVTYDFETDQISEEKFDHSGIHYQGNEILHKSVSGTLVFKAEYDENTKSRYLKCWYVENPYALVKIDASLFPVESQFIVVERNDANFKMNWVR